MTVFIDKNQLSPPTINNLKQTVTHSDLCEFWHVRDKFVLRHHGTLQTLRCLQLGNINPQLGSHNVDLTVRTPAVTIALLLLQFKKHALTCTTSRVFRAIVTARNATVGSKTTPVPAPSSRHFVHSSAPAAARSQVELRRAGVAVPGGTDGTVDAVGTAPGA